MDWCCAQVEPRRERLASHCLALAGYQVYQPLLREQRCSHGRKITVTPPLFPGYLFLWVVRGWWDARWSPGVCRLVMDGPVPARVPDAVIDEIPCKRCRLPRANAGDARLAVASNPMAIGASFIIGLDELGPAFHHHRGEF
jgi:transcription antitermination factor NusG